MKFRHMLFRGRRPRSRVVQACRYRRREAIEWLAENREDWWTADCSYPWVDLPLYISAGIVSLDEVMKHTSLSGDDYDRLLRCMKANASQYDFGTLAERRRRAVRGLCVGSAVSPNFGEDP